MRNLAPTSKKFSGYVTGCVSCSKVSTSDVVLLPEHLHRRLSPVVYSCRSMTVRHSPEHIHLQQQCSVLLTMNIELGEVVFDLCLRKLLVRSIVFVDQ